MAEKEFLDKLVKSSARGLERFFLAIDKILTKDPKYEKRIILFTWVMSMPEAIQPNDIQACNYSVSTLGAYQTR